MITVLHTYPDGTPLLEPFLSPFKPGDKVVIPKGTYVNRMGNTPSGPSKTRFVVKIDHTWPSRITMADGRALLQPPTLSWAGSGGYWGRALLTEDVLEANGLSYQTVEPDLEVLRRERYILRDATGKLMVR